jgi:hypothetical protein
MRTAGVLWILIGASGILQDPADELVSKALNSAKEQSSLKVAFTGRVDAPDSDPMDIHGTALQVGKDLLFIEYHASGGQLKFIVRKGEKVLEWHPILEEWIDAQELGDGAAGRGIQNPHEVFDSLLRNRTSAKFKSRTETETKVTIDLNGPRLKPLLRELVDETRVRWKDTEADALLTLDPKTGSLRSAETHARIGWREGEKIVYTGKVVVQSAGEETEYRFFITDSEGKKKEVPLTEDARRELGLPPSK